jgi:uncharacterized RDD family membrane protein YckC
MHTPAKTRKRIIASVIDCVVYLLMLIGYIFTFGEVDEFGIYRVQGMMALPLALIWLLYFAGLEGFTGQTLGKRIVGIRVSTEGGNEIGFGTALIRRFFDMIDFAFAGLIGVIVMKSSSKNQRIADHVANTIVIEDERYECSYCNVELALNSHEAATGIFTCPNCRQKNVPLDLVEN